SVSGWGTSGQGGTVAGTNYVGTSDAVDLVFKTNGFEKMRLPSGASAGLPTGDENDYLVTINNTTHALMKVNPTSTNSPVWSVNGNSGTSVTGDYMGTSDAVSLSLRTNATERMKISSAGAVNIYAGTSQKDVLNVLGDYNEYLAISVTNANTGNKASSDFTAINGSAYYVDMGINSTSYTAGASNILNNPNKAYLYSAAPEAFYIGNGYTGKDLVFFTNYGNTNSNNTADGFEVMRITGGTNAATQQVAIGTATPNGTNKLTVSGSISASAFNVSSDRRLKNNIKGLQYGLGDILKLVPVTYTWVDEKQSKDTQIGLIAQDTKSVIPELVTGDEQKGTLSINYTELVPVLINAIKEQQKQIDELKQKVEKLQK
ncbi:MAG: tail fiber domain-containing protein, partial [Sphingobacteriaceae bacterium]|nr:tail fiber domain-containing protein [Sphingobacteriaceae bacterium]